MSNSELAKFTASIDAAWEDLHSFLAAVTPGQASKLDQAGWSVKHHVTHLAVWEDSVAILFRGGRRHEALGIEEPFYTAGNFDEINEVIRVRLEGTALQEAIRNLEGAHRQLMGHLRTLRDADLNELGILPALVDHQPLVGLGVDVKAAGLELELCGAGGHLCALLVAVRQGLRPAVRLGLGLLARCPPSLSL